MENKSPFASKEAKCQIMDITPEIAKKMLEHNPRNRRIKVEKLAEIKECMAAGRFAFTNASIGFDTDGNLIDGQHRLTAIAETGISMRMVVVFGANQSPYLDRGARRTLADNLTISNGKNYNANMIAAINLLWKLHTRQHHSLTDDKVGICYDLIREDVESPDLVPIFKKGSKVPSYGADYMAAMLVILVSKRFDREKILNMDSLYRDGYVLDGATPSDKLITEQRTEYIAHRAPFYKGSTGQTVNVIERSEAFLSCMLAYLNGCQRKKSLADVRKFFSKEMAPFFDLIDEEFGRTQDAT
ncbi:MAG: hypothetical protein II038_06495 [Lachnospiraceae bacterium]|nr:hypothetical protein [Lachnospiraceae bacterium]